MAKINCKTNETQILFKNPILERLTKTNGFTPLIIFLAVSLFFLITAIRFIGFNFSLVACFIGGIFLWTFTEYITHRFVFHMHIKNKTMDKFHYYIHGIHHSFPDDFRRLVLPLTLSIPLAFIFYYLFALIIPKSALYPVFSGFVLGYALYDTLHYMLHRYSFNNGILKYLKSKHMKHHFLSPSNYFGVTSPIWDKIFGTNSCVSVKKN